MPRTPNKISRICIMRGQSSCSNQWASLLAQPVHYFITWGMGPLRAPAAGLTRMPLASFSSSGISCRCSCSAFFVSPVLYAICNGSWERGANKHNSGNL
eukprot:1155839-Pelagomonas_calceolata.AAC.27